MEHKYQKSEAGQSQLILSLFFLLLASSAVLAYNATMNTTLTMTTTTITTNISTIEQKVQVEVWANTSIKL